MCIRDRERSRTRTWTCTNTSGHRKATEEDGDPGTPGKEIWSTKREVKVAAQDKAGWREVVCGLCATGSDKAYVKSSDIY